MGKLLIENIGHEDCVRNEIPDVDTVADCFDNLDICDKKASHGVAERKESSLSEECNNTDEDATESSTEDPIPVTTQDAEQESCDENSSDSEVGKPTSQDDDSDVREDGKEEDDGGKLVDNVNKAVEVRREGVEEHGSEDEEVEYNTRGPCKVSSHFGGRYNPMMNDVGPPSPHINFGEMSLDAPLTPESPAMQGYGQSLSPSLASPGYMQPEALESPLPDLSHYSPADCYGAGAGHSPSYGYSSYEPLFPEDASPAHPSSDYLATLQNVVARNTASGGGACPSPDNVLQVMASLRNITPGELDYISPASPTPLDDLEAALDLPSPSPPSEPSPASSPDCREHAFLPSPPRDGATEAFAARCDAAALAKARRNVASKLPEDLCAQDMDGDTVYMIVVCKPASSAGFYEKVMALQEALARLRLCCGCGALLRESYGCGCGATEWRTPLSTLNVAGESALSCAVQMSLPAEVVDFLLAGLARCPRDLQRVVGARRPFYAALTARYPGLARFL